MERKPQSQRSKRQARQRDVADLPLFSRSNPDRPNAAVPKEGSPPARPLRRSRRLRFRDWIAVCGLGLLVLGAWMLVPGRQDEDGGTFAIGSHGIPTVVIDAGHGGHDNGASRNGLLEKNLTLDTALRLEKKLRARGFPVVLTRRDDRFLELTERSDIANRIPRALFVSVHFNDNTSASGDGVETYYASEKTVPGGGGWSLVGWFREKPEAPPADNGLGLARAVQDAVVGGLGAVDRGVKQARYVVIRQTRCPAVLVEGGFLNNPEQAREIAKPVYRERLAAAIAEGISAYQRERLLGSRKAGLAQAR